MWQHLIETALLGTEKKILNTNLFPLEICDSQKSASSDAELAFLEIAALSCLYIETGRLPMHFKGQVDSRVIEETKDLVSAHFAHIFHLLENLQLKFKEKLYNLWLDQLIKRALIIMPEMVIQLLNTGNSFSDNTKTKILEVIGNKGNWIVSLHTIYQYHQPLEAESVWIEGNSAQRKSYLTKLLKTDPNAAVALVRSTWEQEPLVNKRIYLEQLKNLNLECVNSFAQELYEGEFTYNPKEKKTEKECRGLVVEILLASKESPLHLSTIKQLSNYLISERKRGLLGLVSTKGEMAFKLPEEGDEDFWNCAIMEQRFGFEGKNYDISLYKNIYQFWLASFLVAIPIEYWMNESLTQPADFFSCFLENDHFKIKDDGMVKPVFLNSIMKNVLRYENEFIAQQLISRVSATAALPLLKHLKPEDFELFIRKNKYFTDSEMLDSGPSTMEEPWSLAFSEYLLSSIYDFAMQGTNYNLGALGMILSQYLHTEAFNELQKIQEKASGLPLFHQWNVAIYEPVNTVLQIRKLIKTSNT